MARGSFEQDRIRLAAFAGLERLIDSRGGFATRDELLNFDLEGRRFPLIDYSRGIRIPADFDETLSVVDNTKLRAAMLSKKPICLQYGIQAMNGVSLTLPRREGDWPSRDALATRFEAFVS